MTPEHEGFVAGMRHDVEMIAQDPAGTDIFMCGRKYLVRELTAAIYAIEDLSQEVDALKAKLVEESKK